MYFWIVSRLDREMDKVRQGKGGSEEGEITRKIFLKYPWLSPPWASTPHPIYRSGRLRLGPSVCTLRNPLWVISVPQTISIPPTHTHTHTPTHTHTHTHRASVRCTHNHASKCSWQSIVLQKEVDVYSFNCLEHHYLKLTLSRELWTHNIKY